MERRSFLQTALAAPFAGVVGGALGATSHDAMPAWPPSDSFPLWPGRPTGSPVALPTYQPRMEGAPGAKELHLRGIAEPRLNVFRPTNPDGRAIITCPGGGYEFLSVQNEGIDAAQRFTREGITVAVLTYRLPGEGWRNRANVPLQDAQRAIRLLRARAATFSINPKRIAIMGFSAGGHVAASLMVDHDQQVYAPVDAADRQSARPALAALLYPVISMDLSITHKGSRDHLLGPSPSAELILRRTASRHVEAGAPPCFLGQAIDDTVVPVQNSLDMLAACGAANVPVEAHLFEKGGHGFGFHLAAGTSGALWPDLFLRWSRDHL